MGFMNSITNSCAVYCSFQTATTTKHEALYVTSFENVLELSFLTPLQLSSCISNDKLCSDVYSRPKHGDFLHA